MAIDAVIFDIGNVLMEWNPERFYDRAIGPDRRRAMFAAVDLHGMNEQIDLGAPFRDTIYAAAAANPQWRAEIEMWHEHWIDMAAPAIDHSVRLFRALRARGIPCHALSNFGIDSFELAKRHYDFLDEFDQPYISGHLRLIKPDPAIYDLVEKGTGLDPAAMLFTDDRADNIAAAQARGWQVHHFDGPQGLADRLVAEGLLTPDQAA